MRLKNFPNETYSEIQFCSTDCKCLGIVSSKNREKPSGDAGVGSFPGEREVLIIQDFFQFVLSP